MIASLHGTAKKHNEGELTIEVHDVGYRVTTTPAIWERVEEGTAVLLWISTYVREDRLSLFGFLEERMRTFFEKLLERPGIGPRLALELCGCPPHILAQAIGGDTAILHIVKGIGNKSAEKLAIELRTLASKHPELFARPGEGGAPLPHGEQEDDAAAALRQLGFDAAAVARAIATLPKDLRTSEERLAAALRSL